jgi:hypothetical protein
MAQAINKLISNPNLHDTQLDRQHLVTQSKRHVPVDSPQIVAIRLGSLLMHHTCSRQFS